MTDEPEVLGGPFPQNLVQRVGIEMYVVAYNMRDDCRPEWEALNPVCRQELFEGMARVAISIIKGETNKNVLRLTPK